jgi:hypothetical protein
MGSSFAQAEYLRVAVADFGHARAAVAALPVQEKWDHWMARSPLQFFDDFSRSDDVRSNWTGFPEQAHILDGDGNLQWDGRIAPLQVRTTDSAGWQDYTLALQVFPEGVGTLGLGQDLPGQADAPMVWLEATSLPGPEGGQPDQPDPKAGATEVLGADLAKPCLIAGQWNLVTLTLAQDQAYLTSNGAVCGHQKAAAGDQPGNVSIHLDGTRFLIDYVAVTDPVALPR